MQDRNDSIRFVAFRSSKVGRGMSEKSCDERPGFVDEGALPEIFERYWESEATRSGCNCEL